MPKKQTFKLAVLSAKLHRPTPLPCPVTCFTARILLDFSRTCCFHFPSLLSNRGSVVLQCSETVPFAQTPRGLWDGWALLPLPDLYLFLVSESWTQIQMEVELSVSILEESIDLLSHCLGYPGQDPFQQQPTAVPVSVKYSLKLQMAMGWCSLHPSFLLFPSESLSWYLHRWLCFSVLCVGQCYGFNCYPLVLCWCFCGS